MIITDTEARLAYTYAWWLTGDGEAAEAAVTAAVGRPEVPGADDDLRREILLRRVRAAAVQEATMCPASELALLHDGIGLPLDSAAGLALIDPRDARTELAHGRLEALGAQEHVEVVEPERLGGLAVGNPADVAAARQNPKLASLRSMIMQGRDELVSVTPVDVPEDFLDRMAVLRRQLEARSGAADSGRRPDSDAGVAAGAETPAVSEHPRATVDDAAADDLHGVAEEPEEGGSDHDVLADIPVEEAPGYVPGPQVEPAVPVEDLEEDPKEVDLSRQVKDVEVPLGTPGRRGGALLWSAVGLALVVVVALVVVNAVRSADPGEDPTLEVPGGTEVAASEAATTDAPSPSSGTADTATPDVSPSPGGGQDADGTEDPDGGADQPAQTLVVTGTGVAVGLGADPAEGEAVADPFQPVSFEVTYEGAGEGDTLVADWTVDGAPFDNERVDLLPGAGTSRFSQQVPADGWPLGAHVLDLRLGSGTEVLATLRFTVVPEGDPLALPDDES